MENTGNKISNWLAENQQPEIDRFVEKNLAIVDKVRQTLENKGWTMSQLAKEMDKKPSEVSKWLSGMHNLTLKSIIKLEDTLSVDLIEIIENTKKDTEKIDPTLADKLEKKLLNTSIHGDFKMDPDTFDFPEIA